MSGQPADVTSNGSKLITFDDAARLVAPGSTVMSGGFGMAGTPVGLISALSRRQDLKDLTVISNNLGDPGEGLDHLLSGGQLRKAIGSYFTANPNVAAAFEAGELEVELIPQGTLAEAIRAGGAGIAGFFVRTGVGTALADGHEEKSFDGDTYLLQMALKADVALVRAYKADELGNLVYEKTARNFNPEMATAADLVIVEVDEIVPVGELDPEAIITPHLLVDHLVLAQ